MNIDLDSCPDPSSNLNLTNNVQQDNFGENDDIEDSETATSWPIAIGDIQWCKTNRGNDRMCMGGFTYDYMSQSLKKNSRNFCCSQKNSGCRSTVTVFIDSNVYKNSNNIEHNHPTNHYHIKRLLVLQKVKERISMEPTSIPRIIEGEYVKCNMSNDDRCHFLLPSAQGKQVFHI